MQALRQLLFREWHLRLRWYIIAILAIGIILGLLNASLDGALFFLTLVGLGYAAHWFYEWRQGTYQAVAYLTLPVSMGKKWLSRWLVLAFVLPVWIMLCAGLTNLIAHWLHGAALEDFATLSSYPFTWWIVSGILAVASLYFRKGTLIKTVVLLLIILIVAQVIVMFAVDWSPVIPQISEYGGFVQLTGKWILSLIAFGAGIDSLDKGLAYLIGIVTVGWLWLILWIRFREIEA